MLLHQSIQWIRVDLWVFIQICDLLSVGDFRDALLQTKGMEKNRIDDVVQVFVLEQFNPVDASDDPWISDQVLRIRADGLWIFYG